MCVCVCMCRFVCVYTDESMHGSSWHAVLRPQAPTKSLPSGATVNRRTAICTRRRSLSARCPPVSCSSHVHWMRWIRYTRCGWLCVYVCVCVCVCVCTACVYHPSSADHFCPSELLVAHPCMLPVPTIQLRPSIPASVYQEQQQVCHASFFSAYYAYIRVTGNAGYIQYSFPLYHQSSRCHTVDLSVH